MAAKKRILEAVNADSLERINAYFQRKRTIVKLVLRGKSGMCRRQAIGSALPTQRSRLVSAARLSVSHRSAVFTCSGVFVSAESLPIGGRRPPLQEVCGALHWVGPFGGHRPPLQREMSLLRERLL